MLKKTTWLFATTRLRWLALRDVMSGGASARGGSLLKASGGCGGVLVAICLSPASAVPKPTGKGANSCILARTAIKDRPNTPRHFATTIFSFFGSRTSSAPPSSSDGYCSAILAANMVAEYVNEMTQRLQFSKQIGVQLRSLLMARCTDDFTRFWLLTPSSTVNLLNMAAEVRAEGGAWRQSG